MSGGVNEVREWVMWLGKKVLSREHGKPKTLRWEHGWGAVEPRGRTVSVERQPGIDHGGLHSHELMNEWITG